MGGRGSGSKIQKKTGGGESALARAKRISGQITNAKIEGKGRKAAVIDLNGAPEMVFRSTKKAKEIIYGY